MRYCALFSRDNIIRNMLGNIAGIKPDYTAETPDDFKKYLETKYYKNKETKDLTTEEINERDKIFKLIIDTIDNDENEVFLFNSITNQKDNYPIIVTKINNDKSFIFFL